MMEPALSNFRYTKINGTDGANSQETQVNCVLECKRYTTHTFIHMNKDNTNLKHVMLPTRRYKRILKSSVLSSTTVEHIK